MTDINLVKLKKDIEDLKEEINGIRHYNNEFISYLNDISQANANFYDFKQLLSDLTYDFSEKDIAWHLINVYTPGKPFGKDSDTIAREYYYKFKNKINAIEDRDSDRYHQIDIEMEEENRRLNDSYRRLKNEEKQQKNMSVVLGNIERTGTPAMKKVFESTDMRGEISGFLEPHLQRTRKKTGGKFKSKSKSVRKYKKSVSLKRKQKKTK